MKLGMQKCNSSKYSRANKTQM